MKNFLLIASILLAHQSAILAGSYTKTVIAFYAAVDAGKFDLAGTYLNPAIKAYLPFSDQPFNLEGFRAVGMNNANGFPDMHHEVLEVIEGKSSCAFRARFTGTNNGMLNGQPATGNRVDLPFQGYAYFDAKGLVTDWYISFDVAAFMNQLSKGMPKPVSKATELANVFFHKVVGEHNTSLLGTLLADNFTSSGFPFPNAGKAEFTGAMQMVVTSFPDIKIRVNTQYAEGNKVFTYGTWEGMHKAEFMGVAATGKKVKVDFMDIWTEENGRIIRNEVVMDIAGLMQQIGGSTAANKMAAEKLMKTLNAGNLDGVLALCHPAAQFYGFAPETLNPAGYKSVMGDLLKAFPDYKFPSLDLVAEGDLVVVRHQFEGTHTGAPFQGIGVTKRKVIVPAAATMKFRDGKIIEIRLNADFFGLIEQLKGSPATASKS